MADSMSHLSPEKMNANADAIIMDEDMDMASHDLPSSPFLDHIEIVADDQENIAPNAVRTPVKSLVDLDDNVPQSAFRVSPEKRFGLKERNSPMKTSPVKNLMDDYEDAEPKSSASTPRKSNTPPLPQRGNSIEIFIYPVGLGSTQGFDRRALPIQFDNPIETAGLIPS
ncbi:hypothetical protein PtrM4_150470 [Pyrenophora tritici-repentis]|uniref:Uncharacterized protein n=1 Tax=Pyrenophora tritici-repentis TaxID=45151 RepID=A0A834RNI7_9PLEO|nr:hypothetical protein PtrM4_150470 [Pyrenophora tritici-repentis]